MQCCPEKAETLMTWIRVCIRVCQQKMKTPAKLRTGHGKSTTAKICGNFKKKNVVGEKASRCAYDLLYPTILKLYQLISHYGRLCEETWFCCSVTHARYAQTHTTDTISINISCAKKNRSICFLKQRLIPARLSLGTRIRVCQRIMETLTRLLTGHGKRSKANVCGNF